VLCCGGYKLSAALKLRTCKARALSRATWTSSQRHELAH
jgi:hypothetical protein